ncbi:MAG: hypothetical protein PUC32_04235 [Oscillospiraceae bacterium]|nr:hypothetical protein [Oscillospiraceae bacterium]
MKQNELERLLQIASQRLGTTPEQLKQDAQQGQISDLISNLDPVDAQNLQRVLSDRNAAQQLLDTPEARELMKRLKLQ